MRLAVNNLVLAFMALILLTSPIRAGVLLTSFENEDDLKALDVQQGITIERSTEHVTGGTYSLKLTVSSKAPSKWLNLTFTLPVKDLTPYDYLTMDVYRDQEPGSGDPYNLGTIQFEDSKGNGRPGWVPIRVPLRKATTSRSPVFLGIAQMSSKTEFSFASVAKTTITLDRAAKDYCVYIDNIRLVSAPPQLADHPIPATPRVAADSSFVSFRDRDLDFRVRSSTLAADREIDPGQLQALAPTGLNTNTNFSIELLPLNLVTDNWETPPYTWQNYEHDLIKLHEARTPFVVDAFNFWAGSEKYEYLTIKLKRIIALASELGGDYFVGLRLSESEAAAGYQRVQEQPTEAAKADAFASFIRTLVKDAGLPKDKLLILDVSNGLPYEWAYAAGADIVGQAFLPILPIEVCESALRGVSCSYGRPWGWDVTRWPLGASGNDKVDMPFDPITGRPTEHTNKVESLFFGNGGGGEKADQSDDMYKIYVSAYYNGARYINGFSENPKTSAGRAFATLYQLSKECPRGKTPVSSIAVMRGKGIRWVIPLMSSNEYPAEQTEAGEFLYLNTLFPGFSSDGRNARCWWTGTPFGAVDTICPEMKLANLKSYNVILFLGNNQMDGTRKDFLTDLISYTRNGGTVILSVDQLRSTSGTFDPRLPEFLGLPDPKVLGTGTPAVISHDFGKGRVILFNVPSLTSLAPVGRSTLVQDVISEACRRKPLAIDISPNPVGIQFCLSKTGTNEAVIFVMNHNKDAWTGEITINLTSAGLSPVAGLRPGLPRIDKAILGTGYATKPIKPSIERRGDNLVIKGITLPGDSEGFCTYRKAAFVYVRLTIPAPTR